MNIIAIDTETYRIGPGAVAPKIVCTSFAARAGEEIETELRASCDPNLPLMLESIFRDEDMLTVWAHAAYDLACMAGTWPQLIPSIFEMLEAGRAVDIQLREKLYALSTHGHVDDYTTPDGQSQTMKFTLASLVLKHLGEDRTAEKEDEDSWRLNFDRLDGLPVEEYPTEAARYAKKDALDTLLVYEAQERLRGTHDYSCMTTDRFRTTVSFSLYLMTVHGLHVDQDHLRWIEGIVQAEMVPENFDLLYKSEILRMAEPSRPHAKGAKVHDPGCPGKKCRCPVKMIAGKPESKNLKRLTSAILATCREHSLPVRITDGGQKAAHTRRRYVPAMEFDKPEYLDFVATSDEAIEPLASLDPMFAQFRRRQMLIKLVDNQLPLLRGHEIVHAPYDYLKETGRVATYGSNHKVPLGQRGNLYPAVHAQGVPGEIRTASGISIDVRRCYVPRPGRAFIDVDFKTLELVCVAQTCYEILGWSRHRDVINADVDCHAYLGAQIARLFGSDEHARAWQDQLHAEGIFDDREAAYRSFATFKKAPDEDWKGFYKQYRTMAKPVGLGFPGGLGPEKLATNIAPQYEVHMTVDQARRLREIWHDTYPEMRLFFEWVNQQRDLYNDVLGYDDIDGQPEYGHWYRSPLGMVRRGATYCATANGKGMQTPGAEAALIGVHMLQRACHDPTRESILYGVRPLAFVHDQVLCETTEDQSTWHEQAHEVARILCEGASAIFKDVKIGAEPVLATVWSKKAEPVVDENGRLIPWSPKE